MKSTSNIVPGTLVVRRGRWTLGSIETGIVVGCYNTSTWDDTAVVVMWTMLDGNINLVCHPYDMLTVLTDNNTEQVKGRCTPILNS